VGDGFKDGLWVRAICHIFCAMNIGVICKIIINHQLTWNCIIIIFRRHDGIQSPSIPTSMSPPLLSLPDEVLVEVFSYLHPRDIAVCQRSCPQLNDIVIHPHSLNSWSIHLNREIRSPRPNAPQLHHLSAHRGSRNMGSPWIDVEFKSFDDLNVKFMVNVHLPAHVGTSFYV